MAMEMSMLRSAAPRDAGKSPIAQAVPSTGLPFREQHLKQLRAQCLVFLAFRSVEASGLCSLLQVVQIFVSVYIVLTVGFYMQKWFDAKEVAS